MYFTGESGEEFDDFVARFEAGCDARNYTNDQKRLELSRCISGLARKCSAHIDPRRAGQRFRDLVAAYREVFHSPQASASARAEFATIRQSNSENAQTYHARVRAAYEKAYPRERLDRIMIEAFVKGMHNNDVRLAVLRANPETFQAALTAALNEEATLWQSLTAQQHYQTLSYQAAAAGQQQYFAQPAFPQPITTPHAISHQPAPAQTGWPPADPTANSQPTPMEIGFVRGSHSASAAQVAASAEAAAAAAKSPTSFGAMAGPSVNYTSKSSAPSRKYNSTGFVPDFCTFCGHPNHVRRDCIKKNQALRDLFEARAYIKPSQMDEFIRKRGAGFKPKQAASSARSASSRPSRFRNRGGVNFVEESADADPDDPESVQDDYHDAEDDDQDQNADLGIHALLPEDLADLFEAEDFTFDSQDFQ